MSKVYIVNVPKNIQNEDFIENIKIEIEEIIKTYKFIKNSGIDTLITVIIFKPNENYLRINSVDYQNGKIRLFYLNYPNLKTKEFDNQDTQDKVFRSKFDILLKKENYSELQFDILNIYNKDFNFYNFETFYKKTENEDILFFTTEPKFNFNQIILNDDLLKEIHKTLILIEKRKLIFEDWGFNEIEKEPKAILNFYGLSGTGKTMTAHAIAKHLNRSILALNYADIESKYVGDAPKNLVKAFDLAKKEESVLFFDEADSFLGKRITNITSSSDQAINSLRSQLLILMENFDGVIIFATNLLKNYDRAFESRIFSHLHFGLPSFEIRRKLIYKIIPEKVPFENNNRLNENDLDDLAELSENFSGREIKNAILKTLTDVIYSERLFVNFDDFKNIFTDLSIKKKSINNEFVDKQLISPETKSVLEKKISNVLNNK